MFGSHNQRAYQKIDDDFDDESLRSTCTSRILDSVAAGRNMLFGRTSEEQPLMTTSSASYQSSPMHENRAAHENYTQFATYGPPAMASSAQQADSRRWHHIENLDEFFTHIFEYQQNGGYQCIVLSKIFSLFQFVFIVSFSTFFTQCIDYPFLFANSNTTTHGNENVGKRHFSDAVIENCPATMSIWVLIALIAAMVYWVTRVIKTAKYLLKIAEIHDFYKNELKIEDDQLLNMTWHDIVKRIGEVQPRLRLMIHTDSVSSIDIYHRILRHKNYMVALVNKRIIDPVFEVPLIGKIAYLPNSLKNDMEKIFFLSSAAPWDGPNLKDEYKEMETLEDLARKMRDDCNYFGIWSLVLMPLLLPFQVIESFFFLAELIKRSPNSLGSRRYSNYGRYRMRHFNELDHELNARLNRSYIYAAAYMDQFFSPALKLIAQNVTLVAASIAVTLAALTAWDEDVLQVEHVITVISVCGIIIVICKGMIPDENLVWQPEILMNHVASELHYLPPEWKGKAHTAEVRSEFDQIFQMKWMYFLIEVTSPIFTPFIVLFWLKPRASQIVNFFHDHTVLIDGVGDICSFAEMDVGKHGDPKWNSIRNRDGDEQDDDGDEDDIAPIVTSHNRARDGKTELSVLHFKTTNPEWKGSKHTEAFVKKFKNRLIQDTSALVMLNSRDLGSLGRIPDRNDPTRRNVLLESVHNALPGDSRNTIPGRSPLIGNGLHLVDGPIVKDFTGAQQFHSAGVLGSIYHEQPMAAESLTNSLKASGIDVDGAGSEMRVNSLYLRGLHEENVIQSRMGPSIMMPPMNSQSIFAMPQRNAPTDESLIEMNEPSSSSQLGHGLGELPELQNDARSRLILRREQISDEERLADVPEDNDEDLPPSCLVIERFPKRDAVIFRRTVVEDSKSVADCRGTLRMRAVPRMKRPPIIDFSERQILIESRKKLKNWAVNGMEIDLVLSREAPNLRNPPVKGTCVEYDQLANSDDNEVPDVSDMLEDDSEVPLLNSGDKKTVKRKFESAKKSFGNVDEIPASQKNATNVNKKKFEQEEDETDEEEDDDTNEKVESTQNLDDDDDDKSESEDDDDDAERDKFREELANMPLGKLKEMKEKLGIKLFNKTYFGVSKEEKERNAKKKEEQKMKKRGAHRPREISSKRPVSAFRNIYKDHEMPAKKKKWDPRFDQRAGEFKELCFENNYKFLDEIRSKEIEEIRSEHKMAEEEGDERKASRLKNTLQKMENRERSRAEKARQAETRRELHEENIQRMLRGEAPIFKTKAQVRRIDMEKKYDELKKDNKLDKYLQRKAKKESGKLKKAKPFEGYGYQG
ncbi:unnamed protein product [Caenorhabditis bovis]|uniref:Autophagy-related protein 9 n=1 Tax=Caenorhabditis bovis TaxID=2654633 RepID=A0A8S1E727_9PELO|nr:unnamed protein product [Caenorhabditis bovis]